MRRREWRGSSGVRPSRAVRDAAGDRLLLRNVGRRLRRSIGRDGQLGRVRGWRGRLRFHFAFNLLLRVVVDDSYRARLSSLGRRSGLRGSLDRTANADADLRVPSGSAGSAGSANAWAHPAGRPRHPHPPDQCAHRSSRAERETHRGRRRKRRRSEPARSAREAPVRRDKTVAGETHRMRAFPHHRRGSNVLR